MHVLWSKFLVATEAAPNERQKKMTQTTEILPIATLEAFDAVGILTSYHIKAGNDEAKGTEETGGEKVARATVPNKRRCTRPLRAALFTSYIQEIYDLDTLKIDAEFFWNHLQSRPVVCDKGAAAEKVSCK